MAKNKTLELSIKIAGRIDKSLVSSITTAQSQISGFAREVSRIGTAGLAAMAALGTGAVKIIADCTDEAAKFENYMADVVKYVDGIAEANGTINAKNYAAMSDAILDLSTQIPYTQQELAALAGAAGEAGKTMGQIFEIDRNGNVTGFLRNVAVAGTALDISADQAGAWSAKWEEAFGMTHQQVMELFDQINYLSANGAAAAVDIAQIVNDAGSLAGISGATPADVAAIANAMLSLGADTSTATTSINRMFLNMNKGASATKAQKAAWASLGMTAEGVAKSMQQGGTAATDTILQVLEAVQKLPKEEQLGTLNTLFGGWAVKDVAKVSQSIEVLMASLEMARDKEGYAGSMEREFIIKASTSEAIDTMLSSAATALQIEIGTAFLPAKKTFGLSMIDFLNSIRKNIPELTELANSLGALASDGVALLGQKLDEWLPKIQKGLGWLTQNGDQVVSVIKGLAIGFGAMKLAPGAVDLVSWAGNLLFGQAVSASTGITGGTGRSGGLFGWIKNLYRGGKNAAQTIKNVYDNGLFGAIGNAVKGSAVGQYAGGVKSSWGNFTSNTSSLFFTLLGKSNTTAPGRSLSGNLAQGITGTLASGAGLLGNIWGPFFSGFGSLLSGALPIVGVISTIIAVVSILGDHLEGIRGIVGSVFGEQGVAVFDGFVGRLTEIGSFITGLFAEGGVAAALAPLRENIVNLFGPDAAAAFDGVTMILQSVMGVIGQLVNFSITTVKPIIENIFSFITQRVMPVILQTIAAAAPYVSGIISSIGSGIMTVAQIIGSAVEFAGPLIAWLGSVLLDVGQVTIPAVMAYFEQFAIGLSAVMENAKVIFGGLTTFLTGVFTGDWSLAWQGIQDIFGGAFDALVNLCKTPVNAVITLINKAIEGINSLGITIPEWVPVFGGNSWSIDIPPLQMLAKGGFTQGVSIAGEAGTEAVISFQRSERRRNIAILAKAARMLGVKPVELKDPGGGNEPGGGTLVFAPNIVIQGNADRAVIDEALARARAEFEQWYIQMQRRQNRTAY